MTASVARYAASSVMVLALGASAACSNEADTASSGRGGGQESGETSVENVFIVPATALTCGMEVDEPAKLSFTAVNDSSTEQEMLSSISTPAAESVEIDAPLEALTIGPEDSIAAGQPVPNADDPAASDQPFSVALQGLGESVEPGTSFPVTFAFKRAGDITLNVPVDACPVQEE